ncbi:tetratricopeptide repeat protein [Jiella marina]|uniref:tetratricopeptide repeat protein n=1 Tax=Jiella sp. LLJ827 TaxID=2917712 RepID=UPI00210098AB|nr:tetratricopeptide repeat protein [Jiella sp. LLJ827]MCQ0988042.1 sel1 repeat family protein [Jiella sp. LLJ827]
MAATSATSQEATPTPELAAAGRLYEHGRFEEAAARFADLAEKGDALACFWLSICHANGDGLPRSDEKAFETCLRAAELGNVQAKTNLGVMYIEGKGVVKDAERGLAWLGEAAEDGDMGAQFNAATILSAGKAVEQDWDRAVRYYRMAAERGYYPAQARLGFCYRNGLGVEKSRVQAFVWLSLAAQHGVGTAITILESTVNEMSADEKAEGMALVRQWQTRTRDVSERASFRVVP